MTSSSPDRVVSPGVVGSAKSPAAVAALEPLATSDDLLLRYLANRALRRLRGS